MTDATPQIYAALAVALSLFGSAGVQAQADLSSFEMDVMEADEAPQQAVGRAKPPKPAKSGPRGDYPEVRAPIIDERLAGQPAAALPQLADSPVEPVDFDNGRIESLEEDDEDSEHEQEEQDREQEREEKEREREEREREREEKEREQEEKEREPDDEDGDD